MAKHLILFDIDGTLIHAAGAGRIALTQALATEFGVAEPIFEVGLAGRTDRAIASEALKHNGLEDDDGSFDRYLGAYFRKLPEVLQNTGGRVLPGVVDLLVALRSRPEVALGLLTGNAEKSAWIKLQHFGLDHFFFGGAFGDHYPDRNDVARSAQRNFAEHLDPSGVVWVVGDTPADIRCARAIGARAIAVSAGFSDSAELEAAEPDVLLEDLRDVEGFLGRLDTLVE